MDVKAKYVLLETKMRGMETEGCRLGNVARGVETALGGHSAYQEAPEVILLGSWQPYTPSLVGRVSSKPVKTSQNQSKLLNLKFGEFYEHIFHRVNKVGYSSTFMNIHFIELIK